MVQDTGLTGSKDKKKEKRNNYFLFFFIKPS